MYLILRRLLYFLKPYSKKDKKLIAAIKAIVGSRPLNLHPYKLATQHTSVAIENRKGYKESNERLEFLGDAVLGMVVAEYLFLKFPYKEEGFLTEIRSRIVNRESLNNLARKIGVSTLVEYNQSRRGTLSHKSIYGDTLEAFIGAVYLDKGFRFCQRFIIQKLLVPHYDIDAIVKTNPNHKSKIIEWAQKESRELRFEITEKKDLSHHFKEFTAQIFIDDEPLGAGTGYSKKKAEQSAAEKSCEILNL